MASNIDWASFLDKKYPSYTVEVNAFLDSLDISKSTDVCIENIYLAIRQDDNVNSDLKLLYHETIYGTNRDVKARIQNRVANFCRSLRYNLTVFRIEFYFITIRTITQRPHCVMCVFRGHPKVKGIDMMHAADYSNMKLDQMERKLRESKKNDEDLIIKIEYGLTFFMFF